MHFESSDCTICKLFSLFFCPNLKYFHCLYWWEYNWLLHSSFLWPSSALLVNKRVIFPKLRFSNYNFHQDKFHIWCHWRPIVFNCNFNWRVDVLSRWDLVNSDEHASRTLTGGLWIWNLGPCGFCAHALILPRSLFLPSLHTLKVGTDEGSSQSFPPDITLRLHTLTHNGPPWLPLPDSLPAHLALQVYLGFLSEQ